MCDLRAEQKIIRDTAGRYAREQIAPWHEEGEACGRFRPEVVAEIGELGFWGALLPEEYGGTEAGFLTAVLVTEEFAKVSPPPAPRGGTACTTCCGGPRAG